MYDGKGGHQTVKGVLQDAEKYEAALLAGWRVYRVPGPWIAEGRPRDMAPAGHGQRSRRYWRHDGKARRHDVCVEVANGQRALARKTCQSWRG